RTIGLLLDWTFPLTVMTGAALCALAGRGRRDARERSRREADLARALQKAAFARKLEEQALQLREGNARLQAEAAERRRMEEQLVRAQRMEAIGQLTAGIAHDFNNLLTAVLGNLDRVIGCGVTGEAQRMLATAMRAAERGARLTSHLLAFGRR